MSVSDLEDQLLGKCASEWEDTTPVYLPKGYIMPQVDDIEEYIKKKFSKTFKNKKPKFNIFFHCGWHVQKICPCGLTKCNKHVIPSETDYQGSTVYKSKSLSKRFSKFKVLTIKEAQDWWDKFPGTTVITPGVIKRTVLIPWPYTFPKGHELQGPVDELEADDIVLAKFNQRYSNNQKKFDIVGHNIYQLCQCGLKECTVHVIPSTVEIKAGFKLEMHVDCRKRGRTGKRKDIEPNKFGKTFRKMDPLSLQDTRDWFLGVGLNYTVDVQPKVITLKMVCKCGQSFLKTPCKDCAEKDLKECQECAEKYKKRMLKKYKGTRICGNCWRMKIQFCTVCNTEQRMDHPCLPLVNQMYSGRINTVYPPIMIEQDKKDGICPDCKEGVNYNVYHRHQYRRHSDLKPCDRYTRRYKVHFCHYCDYTNCEITNVREHEKFHYTKKLHKCNFCSLKFSRASSRALHQQAAHQEFSGHEAFRVTRRGNTVVRERRIGTIQYLA